MKTTKLSLLIATFISVVSLFMGSANADNVYRFKLPKDIYDSSLPKDCASLLASDPSYPSSYVTLFPNGLNGPPVEVYCDMETDGGGWTRIMSLGVGKSRCFGDFTLNPEGYCVKSGKVLGFIINTMGIPYSEIRGGVSAYQSGSNDGFRRYQGTSAIDDTYVDGISFTYNDSLGDREHIFTYVIGQSSAGNRQSCPALGGDSPPSFVGAQFHCDTGNTGSGNIFDFYPDEIFSGLEFSVAVSSSLVQELEVRVMNDQGNGDENIALNGIYILIR